MSTETTTRPAAPAEAPKPTAFTDAEHAMLDAMNVPANRQGRALLFREMQRTGLDPFAKHLYLREDWNKSANKNVYAVASTIDGFRIVAARQTTYEGQTAPQWCDKNGRWQDAWFADTPPVAARIGVYVRGYREPMWGIARFNEYKPNGNGGFMWAKMPALMIAKVAEALAIRKAYPDQLSGVYTDDEMQQADARRDEESSNSGQRPARRQTARANDEWNSVPPQAIAEQQDRDAEESQERPAAATPDQVNQILATLKAHRVKDREQARAVISKHAGREIGGPADLTAAEAEQVLEKLTATLPAAAEQQPETAPPVPAVGTPDNPLHTPSQMKMIQATLAEKDITDPQAKRDLIGRILGVRIERVRDLSRDQASKVIEHFHTGEIPPPAPLVDRLAEQMRAAQSSEELADHSEWMWRAHEAGELSQAEVSKLQDISLAREAELTQTAKAAA